MSEVLKSAPKVDHGLFPGLATDNESSIFCAALIRRPGHHAYNDIKLQADDNDVLDNIWGSTSTTTTRGPFKV